MSSRGQKLGKLILNMTEEQQGAGSSISEQIGRNVKQLLSSYLKKSVWKEGERGSASDRGRER